MLDEQMIAAMSGRGVLMDRTHLDAAVTGLLPLAELVRNVCGRRVPYVPLAELMAGDKPAAQAWRMTPPARLLAPPSVNAQTWAGTTAELLLVGQEQHHRPTGMALLSDRTALVTCPDGLLAVDTGRGHAHWHLALPGCHGAPVVRQNGAVLVLCGSALVHWHDGQLLAVAGGFEDGAVLIPGPDGEPWVLSGSGVTFGTGQGTLTLTRAGDNAGDQVSYPITFDAAVRTAAWLDRRRFFLAASGHSAVVARTARRLDPHPRFLPGAPPAYGP
ncbi:hypothetical protein [Streptomyces mirabilis]|uniref:hypothetical protein n=2 Tax=Streptomyces mirabilis TaxID=68239 RepID=UPI00224EE4B4|nr:hypothetical protein [Streptomyces mirabilis]MCX4428784.1 hypothetical protein [Streptomyces mirabilis]